MEIDLHNFFKFYKPENPQHVAAVQWLENNLPKEYLDSNSEWVKIFRTPASKYSGNNNVLQVPYYPQTDNYRDSDRTCNSSSCAMCLEYFKPGTLPPGPKGDDAYVNEVFKIGDTTDHIVQTKVLQKFGIKSHFNYNLTFADIDREIAAGRPVVIGILHRGPITSPRGGHMCVVIGKKGDDYIVNDPYGNLNDGYSSDVYNGKGAVYKKIELKQRWCPNGNDGWGRIFDAKK
jgi:hypothetical protein